MGSDAAGYIIHTEDGHMAFHLMASSRPKFAAAERRGLAADEKGVAADTFNAYCGTYDIRGNTVVHHIELGSFPHWVGPIG
jgi:hypothetical protein